MASSRATPRRAPRTSLSPTPDARCAGEPRSLVERGSLESGQPRSLLEGSRASGHAGAADRWLSPSPEAPNAAAAGCVREAARTRQGASTARVAGVATATSAHAAVGGQPPSMPRRVTRVADGSVPRSMRTLGTWRPPRRRSDAARAGARRDGPVVAVSGNIPDAEAAVDGLNARSVEAPRERADLVVKT